MGFNPSDSGECTTGSGGDSSLDLVLREGGSKEINVSLSHHQKMVSEKTIPLI
jgi:hypothetical protein